MTAIYNLREELRQRDLGEEVFNLMQLMKSSRERVSD